MSRMISHTTVQPLPIPWARWMVPALLSLALLALTMLQPELALAAVATGQLRIENDTDTAIRVTVAGKSSRTVQPNGQTTFEFTFSSCRKTKTRLFDIKRPFGDGWSTLVGHNDGSSVKIESVRKSGSCKAEVSFPKFNDAENDSYTCTRDNTDTNNLDRTGVVVCQ